MNTSGCCFASHRFLFKQIKTLRIIGAVESGPSRTSLKNEGWLAVDDFGFIGPEPIPRFLQKHDRHL
jgi:hypothetical protein